MPDNLTAKAHRLQSELLIRERDLKKITKRICLQVSAVSGVLPETEQAVSDCADNVRQALKEFHDAAARACNDVGIQPLTGGTDKPDEE